MNIRVLSILSLLSVSTLEAYVPISPTNPNQNEQNVADNLNALRASGALDSDPSLLNAYNSLASLSDNTLNQALDQLHPAPYSAFPEIQAAVGGQILTTFHRKPAPYCCCSSPLRAWAEPYGNWLQEKNLEQELGFTANSKGIAFGVDGEVLEGWVVGAGGIWNDSHLYWKRGQGRATMNGYYGAIYTDYSTENVYVGASFLAGLDRFNTSRHIRFSDIDTKAHGHYYGTEILGQISTALFFGPSMCFMFPYFNIDFLYLNQHSYQEEGAAGLDLDVRSNGQTTMRTEAGFALQVSDMNAYRNFCFSPLFSLGWAMECPLSRPNYKATFADQSSRFQATGWDHTWQLFTVRFGATFSYKCVTLFSGYVAEMNPVDRTPYFDQRGDIRLDCSW